MRIALQASDAGSRPKSSLEQALQIGPIFASVVESSGGDGGGQQIDQVSARVFDPLTGNEVSDAAVSIVLGDASVSLGWDTDADIPSYSATFGPGTLGQATYTVTASSWDGAAQLVAPDPAPTGAIFTTRESGSPWAASAYRNPRRSG